MDDDTLRKRMFPDATDLAKLGSGRPELDRALENIAARQTAASLLERYTEAIRPNSMMVELERQWAEAEKFRKHALFADSIHISLAATAEKYLADIRASDLALQDRMAKQLLDMRHPAFDLVKYEVPKLAALDFKLADYSAAGAIAKFLESQTRNQLRLSRIAADLTAPWARIADPLLSAKALVEVHSLGEALRNGHAFEEAFSTALRADLGDWRDPVVFDPDALLGSARRTALYVERGFEQSLTDFPEPVYAETLEVTGIAPNYLLISLEELVPPPASPDDAARYQRALRPSRPSSRARRTLSGPGTSTRRRTPPRLRAGHERHWRDHPDRYGRFHRLRNDHQPARSLQRRVQCVFPAPRICR